MNFRLVLVVIALAVPAALAGCFGKETPVGAEDCTGTDCPVTPAGVVGADGQVYPEATKRKTLATGITASSDWVKPGDELTLEAKPATGGATGAVTYSWGYVPRKPTAAPTALDTKNIDGGKTGTLTFATEGTYFMHCHPHPFMKLIVNVDKAAKTKGVAHVAILDGEKPTEFRFAPDEITVAPGTKITFWNNGTLMHTATMESYEPLPKPIGTGQKVTFKPTEEGDFNVVLSVKDAATGAGKATARVLVDASKPDETVAVAPMTGSWEMAFPGELAPLNEQVAAPKSHDFAAEYEIVSLTGTITASGTPQGDVTVSVTDEAGTEVATGTGSGGSLSAANLPAGKYTVTVTPVGPGGQISYEVAITYVQKLVPPAEAPASEGEHSGGHAH